MRGTVCRMVAHSRQNTEGEVFGCESQEKQPEITPHLRKSLRRETTGNYHPL